MEDSYLLPDQFLLLKVVALVAGFTGKYVSMYRMTRDKHTLVLLL